MANSYSLTLCQGRYIWKQVWKNTLEWKASGLTSIQSDSSFLKELDSSFPVKGRKKA